MDFENLISMIMDSEYTPKIIQMIMTTGLNLLDKYLTKKIENQPKNNYNQSNEKIKRKTEKRSNYIN